ncbi:hypothetical protein B0H17DRAFT_1196182 [Mycena rosella]|uniref:Uncharacterized protein n=1 Tax=Mycena rosella TaxID=1033263 RepID=A0AAD7DTR7_MYCRO|nr:hypothetical protein B0H17DRAFT_1196182 [Mycena rosella]
MDHLQHFFGPSQIIDFGHPGFAQLTHFDIRYLFPSEEWYSISTPTAPDLFRGFLTYCTHLEILALVFSDAYYLQLYLQDYRFFEEDPRCVLAVVGNPLLDYELGANGGEDRWVTAARRSRSIYVLPSLPLWPRPRTAFIVPSDDSDDDSDSSNDDTQDILMLNTGY